MSCLKRSLQDLSGNVVEENVYFDGQRVARREVSGSGGTIAVHYYFSDHLGSHGVVENATASAGRGLLSLRRRGERLLLDSDRAALQVHRQGKRHGKRAGQFRREIRSVKPGPLHDSGLGGETSD